LEDNDMMLSQQHFGIGNRLAHCLLHTAFCLLLSALCSLPLGAHAQSTTATLNGTVVDQNGAVVPNAQITVENIGTALKRQTTSNAEGYFTVPLLPPSTYTITAQCTGFAPVRVENVVLNVGDQKTLVVQLKAGDVTATVQVINEAPLINESPAVATVVDRQFVENIPLNGRSFQQLITLTPGVVLTKTGFSEQGQFSVNGQRANANYFTVDGVSANAGVTAGIGLNQSAGGALPALSASGGTNSLVSVDAMPEFKVQTSTFAPEFGRTPGAQVSIATRSGTNDFHGTLFEYFRNDALDANNWFANSRGLKRPALRQNDFGGVLGGPLHLPRFGEGGPTFVSGKNHTFFFFSYEGLRLRLPQTQVILVPSMASRQAAVPRIQPFLNAYPVPNGSVFANGFTEFAASYSDPANLNATSIRIDHTLNQKLAVFGRYNYSPSSSEQRGASGASVNSIIESALKTQTLTLGLTHGLTSTVSNEIRANYTLSEGKGSNRLDSFGGAVIPPDSVLYPSFAPSLKSALIFNLFPNATRLDAGPISDNLQRQVNLIDNLSVVKGSHQVKFGVDYRLLLPHSGPQEYSQNVRFSTAATAIAGVTASATVRAFEPVSLSVTNFSAYGQDTWKATPQLTLTYGLRWDVNPAPKGRNGKDLFAFDNLGSPASLSLAPNGTPFFETTYDNFAPRIGLAYQLSQRQGKETVVRGGFGIFYDLVSAQLGTVASTFPYLRSKSLGSVPFPLTSDQATPPPFSLNIPTSGQVVAADRNLKLPRVYQWNVSVEQSLGSNQTVSATYLGAAGRRLLQQQSVLVPPALFVIISRNAATSDYNAMQLQFQRRLSKGFQALASYTWAHSIDSASNDTTFFDNPSINSRLNRGNSDFDVRHALNVAVTYNIPPLRSGRVINYLSKNWSVDAIVTARSATPVDLVAATSFIAGFQTSVRPDLIPGIPLYINDPTAPGGRRFNNTVDPSRPGCKGPFCPPPAGRQGTLGRNVLRGFPVYQLDLALRRQFNFTERVKLQVRAEAFNLFNHPNFGDPGANFDGANNLSNALFGRSTQMLGRSLGSGGVSGGFNPLYQVGGPRSIQLAVKIQF